MTEETYIFDSVFAFLECLKHFCLGKRVLQLSEGSNSTLKALHEGIFPFLWLR